MYKLYAMKINLEKKIMNATMNINNKQSEKISPLQVYLHNLIAAQQLHFCQIKVFQCELHIRKINKKN